MPTFFMHISMALISFITLFIPQKEYNEKCQSIMIGINKKPTINGWTFDSIYSEKLHITHQYMTLKSPNDNQPTILFLHGLNFDCQVFQKLHELAPIANLISYELPETTSCYKGSIDDYILIINDFLQNKNIDNLILAGTSFGGLIALRYAANGKVSTSSLILLTTKLAGAKRKDLKQTESLERLVRRKKDYQIYWIMERLVNDFKKDLKNEGKEKIAEMLKIRDISFYRQVTYAMSGYKSEEDAKKLSIPVLIINGEGDHLIKEKDIVIFREKMPKAQIEVIENGSHTLTWERSTEISNKISQFLNSIKLAM